MIKLEHDGRTFSFDLTTYAREEAFVSAVKYHRTATKHKVLRVTLPDRDLWIDPRKVTKIEHRPRRLPSPPAMKTPADRLGEWLRSSTAKRMVDGAYIEVGVGNDDGVFGTNLIGKN